MSYKNINITSPGLQQLISENRIHCGSVYASMITVEMVHFDKLLQCLGDNHFQKLMSATYKVMHKLIVKYHGIFSIGEPEMIIGLFGIPKDAILENPFYQYKAINCALDILEHRAVLNKHLKEIIHRNYNEIRNQMLLLPHEDRKNFNINTLSLDFKIGVVTSDTTPGSNYMLRMMYLGSEAYSMYCSQGRARNLCRKTCRKAGINEIWVSANTKQGTEKFFSYGEPNSFTMDSIHYEIYPLKGSIHFEELYFSKFFANHDNENKLLLNLFNQMQASSVGTVIFPELMDQNQLVVSLENLELSLGYRYFGIVRGFVAYNLALAHGKSPELARSIALVVAYKSIKDLPKDLFQLDYPTNESDYLKTFQSLAPEAETLWASLQEPGEIATLANDVGIFCDQHVNNLLLIEGLEADDESDSGSLNLDPANAKELAKILTLIS